jgi:hypothetical protein
MTESKQKIYRLILIIMNALIVPVSLYGLFTLYQFIVMLQEGPLEAPTNFYFYLVAGIIFNLAFIIYSVKTLRKKAEIKFVRFIVGFFALLALDTWIIILGNFSIVGGIS